MTLEHGAIPANKDAIHVPYEWTYANAAARTGASGFVSGDIGKAARQTDNNTLWMLTATTPTWVPIGAGSAFMQTLMDDADAATARTTLGSNLWHLPRISISTSGTISTANLGKHIFTYNSPSLTLPLLADAPDDSVMLISCFSGTTTIARNGSETLNTTSSVASFTLAAGDFAFITKAGTSWTAMICRATVAQVSPKILTFTRDMSSASGNVDYTGLGFQPSAALVIAGGSFGGYNVGASAGLDDGTNRAAMHRHDASQLQTLFNNTSCVSISNSAGGYQTGTMSMLSDGVRIAWTKTGSPTGTAYGRILCWR